MKKETHDKPKQVGTAVDIKGHDQIKRVYSPNGKSPTVTTCGGGHREPKVITGGAMRGRAYDEDGKRMDKDGKSVASKTTQMLELRKDGKSNAITTVGKDSLVVSQGLEFSHGLENGRRIEDGKNLSRNYSEGSRVYKTSGKAATLTAQSKGGKGGHTGLYGDEVYWRKLTPLECERLQTVPDNYTNHVSNTQRYKMLGNGWTIEVIAHIFENMKLLEDGKDLPKPKGQDTFDF
jgi:DNA (cytosine-5)-methyltransferase 3A